MTPLGIALVCWLVACAGASLLHLLTPRRIASHSAWGSAPGWQREVAAWNAALCVAIIYALISRDEACRILLGLTMAALSVLLGANHLAATRLGPSRTHTIGIVANGVGLALLTWGLLSG